MSATTTERIGSATLILGDARQILPTMDTHGTAMLTDPPWDQARGIPGAEAPRELFAAIVAAANCATWIIQLGSYTDPAFLAPLSARATFLHIVWLRYVPTHYRGRLLVDADVAYVFGTPPPSAPGRRVLGSMCVAVAREDSERHFLRRHGRNRSTTTAEATTARLAHPMPRMLAHVAWLARTHTAPDQRIIDPCMGSGTTAVAAIRHGRAFTGIEIHPPYFAEAVRRARAEVARYALLSEAENRTYEAVT